MTFVAHCDVAFERINLSDIPELTNPTFLIGPEGDFAQDEILLALNFGFRLVTLGDSRLRTETAGVVACAIVNAFK
jgi:16S rRNA (uracil1498-N3)-methyltransferase